MRRLTELAIRAACIIVLAWVYLVPKPRKRQK